MNATLSRGSYIDLQSQHVLASQKAGSRALPLKRVHARKLD
jgi:hypothetical protein